MSDLWGKRKPLLLVGYGLAALVRGVAEEAGVNVIGGYPVQMLSNAT